MIDRSHGQDPGLRQDVHRERNPRHFLLVCLTHLAGVQRLAVPCKSKTNSESTGPEKEGQSNSRLTTRPSPETSVLGECTVW